MSSNHSSINSMKKDIVSIKKIILELIYNAQSGHPGGSLSCTEILYLLYTKILHLNFSDIETDTNDIFILSKGHAAPALYATLAYLGYINDDLSRFRQLGSILQGHPVKNSALGIRVSTGSLGMGLSIGVGCALSAKLDNDNDRYIYVLLGDGELDEGSNWEAIMSANHYKLDNLIAIIDRNGIQIDGATEEIMSLEPLGDKFRSFGWQVIEVDGSNLTHIIEAFQNAKKIIRKPKVIISYLVKGSDISFMEHTKKFHGRAPNSDEYKQALAELELIRKSLQDN